MIVVLLALASVSLFGAHAWDCYQNARSGVARVTSKYRCRAWMQDNLLPYARQAPEEAWATKLERQVCAFKSARAEPRSATEAGVLVVLRPSRSNLRVTGGHV